MTSPTYRPANGDIAEGGIRAAMQVTQGHPWRIVLRTPAGGVTRFTPGTSRDHAIELGLYTVRQFARGQYHGYTATVEQSDERGGWVPTDVIRHARGAVTVERLHGPEPTL